MFGYSFRRGKSYKSSQVSEKGNIVTYGCCSLMLLVIDQKLYSVGHEEGEVRDSS